MPIYEYRCSACGFEKDALQKMSDPPLVVCPKCGGSTLVKLVSAAGFQLKGSGWYATDFRNSGAAKVADKTKSDAKPAGAESASGADSGSSSDSKSADKTPAATPKVEAAKPAASSTPDASG